ncbi:MAG: aromatic ring-hydroxylating dioxygenase subunit alpha [Gammaproteobacteria bacterium]|nr:aromatic ring-hydroxylating dioxygenase subunit alpha [Gammaproteobacteria bacterium]
MFAQDCWYVAGWDHDVCDDTLHAIRIADEPIVIYRRQDGGLVALEDRCRHRFAPLSLGCREGDDLRCMYHGFKFAPSGRCIEIPGETMIPELARVRSYPVVSRHSWIWVWIGAADRADAALIPPAAGLDDPRWCLRHGQLDYAAHYELIHDNLLDFSHLSYVHRNSFGAGPEFATERPRITRLPRGVRVDRWMPMRKPSVSVRSAADPAEQEFYSGYDFLVPGVLLMFSGAFARGTREQVGAGVPPMEAAVSGSFTSQAVTPMTTDTARYFFSWGPNAGPDAETQADAMYQVMLMAFNEDKVIIEAQHRTLRSGPHPAPLPTGADRAVLLFQRLMRSMMPAAGAPGREA